MVWQYFKLREQPFGVTPDPNYLYASASHREALASLLYGLQSGRGFVSLIAKPGMGKTTLLFEVLGRLRDTRTTVFLFQTITTPLDLLRAILIDLGVKDVRESLVDLQTQLNKVLLTQCAARKPVVVVIDEAQNLNDAVLETVRMLSNFETASQKLMQIILVGQPQLAEKLSAPDLLQLRQRISIFAHLTPLSLTETVAYIQHRLKFAGLESNESIFTQFALALIARHSEGIPRNINNLCFNALSLAYALKRPKIDSEIINEVISDLNVRGHLLSADQNQIEPTDNLHPEAAATDDLPNFEIHTTESVFTEHQELQTHSIPGVQTLVDRQPPFNERPAPPPDAPLMSPIAAQLKAAPTTTPQEAQAAVESELQIDHRLTRPVTHHLLSPNYEKRAPHAIAHRWEDTVTDPGFRAEGLSIAVAGAPPEPIFTNHEISSSDAVSLNKPIFEDFNTHSWSKSDRKPWHLTAIALAATVAALCVWLGVVDYRMVFPQGAAQASAKDATPTPIVADSQDGDQQQPEFESEHRRSIRVKKVESLATVCDNLYGQCTPELLQRLLVLNPSILYPNRLHPGQIISVPLDSHTAKTER
jgi:type II secretory pathway predicted ATPase ExeA